MEKILGVDLGSNSIGLTLRENEKFTWYGVYTFKKGVGEGKSGEFSLAAERTKHRSSRRLYNARRYRKWEALKVLIEFDFCPLSEENLKKWKNYEKGVGRVFPVDDELFGQWIKLDFNNDGVPDYSSPYQLRRELLLTKKDLKLSINRYKLGRALYHIAQRRGFKSSRKSGVNEKVAIYKGSNETKTIGRNEYETLIIENGSLGAAFAFLEDNGIRVRNRYTLRSDYEKEVDAIFAKQEILVEGFFEKIKKAIFFQRPLRSQKGLIGKCTLEINKPRCPISHPRFEEYRAWSFLNNIKYRRNPEDKFQPIPLEIKEKIYNEKFFLKSKKEFKFSEIRKFIEANGGKDWELNYGKKMDGISVPSCIVSARLKSVLGDDWKAFKQTIYKKNKKGQDVSRTFKMEDIWHLLFSYEDEERFIEICDQILNFSENQVKELVTLFKSFPAGYANFSLKAINKILPFLRKGMIYTDAVILAKIPDLLGVTIFEDNQEEIIEAIQKEIEKNREEKMVVAISNNLIFKYHSLEFNEKFAYKDFSYQLDEGDKKDIIKEAKDYFGELTWGNLTQGYKDELIRKVTDNYQQFFNNPKREHIKPPKLISQIKQFLKENFELSDGELNKIYHPSQIDIYPKKEDQRFLPSPKTRAFKNPMAYKTLYKLRDVINYLIESGKIDEDTRIVVEISRELNDANLRWAIEKYQRDRENENREFAIAISELIKDPEFKGVANPDSVSDKNKFRLWLEQMEDEKEILKEIENIEKDKKLNLSQKEVQKYRLWKEQNCICIYTGKIIKLTDLFDQNVIDFEHTIPRSISFDSSLANLTVCYANYNRSIKNNRIPTELPNYLVSAYGYQAIKPRLEKWEKKVQDLELQVDFWRSKSRMAADKTEKDLAIRQRHLRQMELDYWRKKLERFTLKEVTSGFIRSQLVDTQIISKYAFHYLKTVFNKVDVQKGTNTAQFRKIFGIQKKNATKDRSKHFHHAIDAAVLTLIPAASKKQEILKRSFEYEEQNGGKQYVEEPFRGFRHSMIEEIERIILVNNLINKDRTLTPSKKVVRKRGRIVWLDKEKKEMKIAQGDSIRGELHLQTYYGKIKIAEKEENGSLKRDEKGNVIFNQVDGQDEVWMVIRKPIDKVNFSTDIIIDPHLAAHLKAQIDKGVKTNELTDFQGKVLRHLRCRVKAARGFMNPENATVVKEQVYKSKKDYKNFVYADSGENYMFGLYENEFGRQIVPVNKFEAGKFVSQFKGDFEKRDLFRMKEPVIIKKKEAFLVHIFEVGQKVLFFEESKEELKQLEKDQTSNRLYFVKTLFDARGQKIQFQHHLEARNNEELLTTFPKEQFGTRGRDGFSRFSLDFVAPRLLLTPGNFNFIIEGRDFEMALDGEIRFKF